MIFIGKLHKIIMVDSVNFSRFNCLNDQMTGYTLKKTGNGKKELPIHCDPFGYFFFIFMIVYPDNSFFNKVKIIRDNIGFSQHMIFG